MTFLTAWAIDGTQVPASMARRETYRDTKGATGVTLAGDLKVTALPTPGGAVRIMPGSGVMLNRYPGGGGQSYGVANDAAVDLTVPATGSGSGATTYVIVRVDDPEFGGQSPAVPPYPILVSSIDALTYPFLPLAMIVQPISTATITQAMITDLRVLPSPRRERLTRVFVPAADTPITVTAANGQKWPYTTGWSVLIPDWASKVIASGSVAGVRSDAGDSYGRTWVQIGEIGTTGAIGTVQVQFDSSTSALQGRDVFMSAAELSVPASIRGTTVNVSYRGMKVGGNMNARADQYSVLIVDLEFVEEAA